MEKPTRDERIMAALAHGSIIVSGLGIVVGAIIWLQQREKSEFAARQALQAVLYQFATLVLSFVGWGCWGCFYALTFIPLITEAEKYADAPPPIFWVGLFSMFLPMILMALMSLYGIIGAVLVLTGRDFEYLILGRMTKNYMEKA